MPPTERRPPTGFPRLLFQTWRTPSGDGPLRTGDCPHQPKQLSCVPRNNELFVRRYDPRRHATARARDPRTARRVRAFVESDAEPHGRRADALANLRRVLADASGEDQPVDAAERCRKRADVLRGLIDEVIDRKARTRRAAVQQLAHVVADARDAEQA